MSFTRIKLSSDDMELILTPNQQGVNNLVPTWYQKYTLVIHIIKNNKNNNNTILLDNTQLGCLHPTSYSLLMITSY